jgi:hypothetical protein
VAPDVNSSEQARERLSEISVEAAQLIEKAKGSYGEVISLIQQVVEKAQHARKQASELQNLKAEAMYLGLSHDVNPGEIETPGSERETVASMWKRLEAELQPVRPSAGWLEKIRKAEEKRNRPPVLTAEERRELERRLKDNVCPICVNFALDGTCTVQSFETCPITIFLDQTVDMIEEMGHRPWMEDYFDRMYRDICPGCKGRTEKDYCPPKEEGDCSLFSYLPTVVRTIEDFLNERAENPARDE